MTLPVKLRIDRTTQEGDLVRPDGLEFETDQGLETAVIISLFTDRRAGQDDALPDARDKDRRGWWGDAYADTPGDLIGSRWWLLRRSKATQETINRAKSYAEEALAWMVEDGVAKSVEVTAEKISGIILGVRTVITRNTDPASRYDRTWELMLNGL